jgi:hypothetical protein
MIPRTIENGDYKNEPDVHEMSCTVLVKDACGGECGNGVKKLRHYEYGLRLDCPRIEALSLIDYEESLAYR